MSSLLQFKTGCDAPLQSLPQAPSVLSGAVSPPEMFSPPVTVSLTLGSCTDGRPFCSLGLPVDHQHQPHKAEGLSVRKPIQVLGFVEAQVLKAS